jgi:hypothetical protein
MSWANDTAGGSGVSASLNRMVVPFPKVRVLILPSGSDGVGGWKAGDGRVVVTAVEVVLFEGKASDGDKDSVRGRGGIW